MKYFIATILTLLIVFNTQASYAAPELQYRIDSYGKSGDWFVEVIMPTNSPAICSLSSDFNNGTEISFNLTLGKLNTWNLEIFNDSWSNLPTTKLVTLNNGKEQLNWNVSTDDGRILSAPIPDTLVNSLSNDSKLVIYISGNSHHYDRSLNKFNDVLSLFKTCVKDHSGI
jgi:hypothetical protein